MTDVRPARPEDLPHLQAVEAAADAMFEQVFGHLDWDPPQSGAARAAEPGFLLVAGDPVVGFAHVLFLDGFAHLEQLAVDPGHGRRGIGTTLVESVLAEAAARGFAQISLATYADVPWNAPFYRRLGFREVGELLPYQERLRVTERRIGLDRHGRRVVMERPLPL